jgi:hypothetical protein
MDPSVVLIGLAVVAVVFVLLPVGAAMASRFRDARSVRCPESRTDAVVTVGRAGLAEVLGTPAARRITTCSLWPERGGCAQACRLHIDGVTEERPAA